MRNTILRTTAAALAAGLIALLGVTGPQASAADPLIDPTASTHLVITKILGYPTGDPNNGKELSSVAGDRLNGVKFDVYQVGYTLSSGDCPVAFNPVKLTSNQGWKDAAAITGYTPTPGQVAAKKFTIGDTSYCLDTPSTVTTAGDGVATFDGVVGLYLTVENLTSSVNVTNATDPSETVDKNALTPARPFFTTLPMTDPLTRDQWNYTVYVYPKNQTSSLGLTVQDQGSQLGGATSGNHDLTYTLTSDISDNFTPGTSDMGIYQITFNLPGGFTTVVPSTDIVLVLQSPGEADIPLVLGTHYTVTVTTDPATGAQVIVITFTDAGLVLLSNNPEYQVITTISTTTDGSVTAGILDVTATVIPDLNVPAPIPAVPVDSQYGTLEVTKVDAINNEIPLEGAEFAVYRDGGTDGSTHDKACDSTDVNATNLMYGPSATNSSGLVTFEGLQVSNFYNGSGQATSLYYCVVETKAPSRYGLNPEPVRFTITSPGTSNPTTVTFENELLNLGNQLPLTGGQGIALISIAGLLLVLGGLGYYAVSTRRRRHDQLATR